MSGQDGSLGAEGRKMKICGCICYAAGTTYEPAWRREKEEDWIIAIQQQSFRFKLQS